MVASEDSGGRPLLKPLTGLRGIAAYSVLIAHGISTAYVYEGVNTFQPFAGRIAYFGMSLFFVLSGFVIYYNYAELLRREGLTGVYKFIVARFARLYPLYALVIFFSLDSIPSGRFQDKQIGVLTYATLTQSWFNMQDITFAPTWSISTEWFFYIAFLFLLPLLVKIRRPIFTLVIFLALVFLFLPYLLMYELEWLNQLITRGWVIYYSPFTRIFEFISGCIAAKAYLTNQNDQRQIGSIGFICILVCISWCMAIIILDPFNKGVQSTLLSNFIFAPAIAPLLVFCCSYNTIFSRILSSRLLIFLGEISYSVYLLQFWIITALTGAYVLKETPTINNINPIIKITAIITLTTMIAFGSYNLFEKPCRRWIRNILSPR